jgi:hypothetical protein
VRGMIYNEYDTMEREKILMVLEVLIVKIMREYNNDNLPHVDRDG